MVVFRFGEDIQDCSAETYQVFDTTKDEALSMTYNDSRRHIERIVRTDERPWYGVTVFAPWSKIHGFSPHVPSKYLAYDLLNVQQYLFGVFFRQILHFCHRQIHLGVRVQCPPSFGV